MNRTITEKDLEIALNTLSIDSRCDTPSFKLASDLVNLAMKGIKCQSASLAYDSADDSKAGRVVSIQLAATIDDGDTFAVVPKADDRNTHWSIYLRHEDGEVTYVADFPRNAGRAYSSACEKALELSIKHKAPIEPIP